MRKHVLGVLIVFVSVFVSALVASGASGRISKQTEACLECHASVNPGIVGAWEKSRMAKVTPRAARSMIVKKRRVSFDSVSKGLASVVVGCAECHTLNPEKHQDSFEHIPRIWNTMAY